MNGLLLVLVSYIAAMTARYGPAGDVDDATWAAFTSNYDKNYSSQSEEALRRKIYAYNMMMIDNISSPNSTFTLGENKFSDLTNVEVYKIFGPIHSVSMEPFRMTQKEYESFSLSNATSAHQLPEEIDWRKTPGRVGKVKDQRACASGWAFATTGLLEGQENVRTGRLEVDALSEQNLLDCEPYNYACFGGFPLRALIDIAQAGGIEGEKTYPYHAKEERCSFDKARSIMNIRGGRLLPPGDPKIIMETLVNYGPIAVSMEVSKNLIHYTSGVLDTSDCKGLVGHSVLMVGYGTDPELGDYWLVKNSWGANWGEEGYFRIARDAFDRCSLTQYGVIAVV